MRSTHRRGRRVMTTLALSALAVACSAGAAAGAAETPPTSEERQPGVAQLPEFTVESPSDGEVLDDPRPTFRGTAGSDFANISLRVDGEEYATTRATDDNTWTMTPERDLPVGVPFSITVRQAMYIDTMTHIVVKDLTVQYPRIMLDAPSGGAATAGDVVVEGSSFANAMIGVRIEGDALDEPLVAGMGRARPGERDEEWPGTFDISPDGEWTFTPEESLPGGEYELTAEASQIGAPPELAESDATSSFTVSGDGELPDTGSGAAWQLVMGAVLLILGGFAALRLRGRHA